MLIALVALAGTGRGHAAEVSLITQVRASVTDAGGETTGALSLHRLRPFLGASLADDTLRVRTQLNLTPGNAELLDAFADVGLGEWARLRVGQFKTPFTTYRARSFASMVLTDWAITSRTFGNERQLGLQLAGPGRSPAWTVGIFAGRNQRAAHRVRLPQIYDLPTPNPSSLAGPAPLTDRVGPELFVQVAHYGANLDPRQGRDRSDDGRWRAGISGSVAVHPRPLRGHDFGARAAVDGVVQGHGIGLVGAVYTSLVPIRDQGWQPGFTGALVEADVRIVPWLHTAARAAAVGTSPALQADAPLPYASETELGAGLSAFGPGSLVVQGDLTRQVRASSPIGPTTTARVQLQVAL